MKQVVLLISILFCAFNAHAQLAQVWKGMHGFGANEHIHNTIEATNGSIFAIGYTESVPSKKREGLLLILDARSGQVLKNKSMGGRFEEELRGATQTNEGNFILVGFTGSTGKGKKDAWVVCVDKDGEELWQRTFGTSGNDEFSDVVYNPNTQLITAVGFKNDQKSNDLWVVEFKAQNDQAKEKEYGKNEYQGVKSAAITKNGEVVIVGNATKPKGKAFLLMLKPGGTFDKRLFGRGTEVAEDVIVTSNGNFLLVGSTITRSDGENAWVVSVNKYLDELWNEAFGGEDHDAAMSAAEALDGGFYIIGRTLSHSSNARAERIYLLKVSEGGKREYQKNYGGSKDDIGRAALQLNNGMLFLAADTESDGAKRKDGLFMALRAEADQTPDFRQMKGSLKFVNIDKDVQLNTYDQLLKPNDRTSVAVAITNESELDLKNLSVRIDNSGAKGVRLWETNYIGRLAPNEQQIVHIPVEAFENLEDGKHDFNMTVMAGTASLESASFSLNAKQPKSANLELLQSNARLIASNTRGATNKISVDLTFVNEGDFTANNARLIAQVPNGIQALSNESNLNLGSVAPSGKRNARFVFQPSQAYLQNNNTAYITFRIQHDGNPNEEPEVVSINLQNPSASANAGGKQKTDFTFVEPNPYAQSSNKFQTSDPNFKLKVAISARQKLRTQDIKVYQNKTAVEGNKNFAEEELAVAPTSQSKAIYSRKVKLKEGLNEIYFQIGEDQSEKIVIEYLPRSRNLHVLSIGPKHPDLKYTSKDARDFAEAYRNQQGKLFNEVFITELSTPEQTSQLSIVKAVLDLKNKYDNELILPNDVLIVFISSHGIIGTGDRYKIIPSGFDPAYGDRFTIDYKDDILAPLNKINCKKMILIDACHSGAASSKSSFKDQRRSEMIFRLNAQSPGLSSIASCQSSEMSYEDEAWSNGAFTKAIIEALKNTPIREADGTTFKASNDDDFLTLGELYRFVRRRVAGLIKTYKPDAPTSQTPELINANGQSLDEDIPVYEITGNN